MGRYVENRGWERRMLRNPEGRAAIRGFANQYKDAVPGNVPVRTGELADEYEATGRVRSGHLLYGTPAMDYWTGVHIYHIIEWGSIKNPAYAPLRRTADAMGIPWEGK